MALLKRNIKAVKITFDSLDFLVLFWKFRIYFSYTRNLYEHILSGQNGVIMKRSITLWQFFGFAVVSLLGTLLHFLYDWTGENIFAAPFSGVNESTWEHMKLLYWPLLLFAVIQSFFFRDVKSFWCIKLYGTLSGIFGNSRPFLYVKRSIWKNSRLYKYFNIFRFSGTHLFHWNFNHKA